MTGTISLRKTFLSFLIISIALAVAGVIVAVLAVLVVRFAVGNDSLAVIGLGLIGAIMGYMGGIVIGLAFLRKYFSWKGFILLGAVGVLVWSVAGYLVAMLFGEMNLNPWIPLGFFYATLPFVGLGAYSLKHSR